MKKIIISALLICSVSYFGITTPITPAYATTQSAQEVTVQTNWDSEANLARVNSIGQKILSANGLPETITFKISDDESINAYANIDKEVYVFRGLLENVENNQELAAVIAHELGHIVNAHCAKQTLLNIAAASFTPASTNANVNTAIQTAQQLSLLKVSRNDEFEADRTAVDLLVKTGYNPLALISVLNKICGNYFDLLQTHPSGEKRLQNIYDYANYNYTNTVKTGYDSESYQKAYTMISATLEKRNKSTRKLAKVEKEQQKLKKQQIKRAQRIANSSNPWEHSYAALKLLTGSNSQE